MRTDLRYYKQPQIGGEGRPASSEGNRNTKEEDREYILVLWCINGRLTSWLEMAAQATRVTSMRFAQNEAAKSRDPRKNEDNGHCKRQDGDKEGRCGNERNGRNSSGCSVDQSVFENGPLAVDNFVGDITYYTCGVKRGKQIRHCMRDETIRPISESGKIGTADYLSPGIVTTLENTSGPYQIPSDT
ncbi:hypothetical protein SERLA73DRAFT_153149 [Serpula lacrymans var. lacrymans S7.3]|uniref:Uncharacterized protein n=1 Tax=Serpula lacrymans var. lacrymans (strain S7.3) TaxID=936435 RepID=F8Q0R0_SERL3|nr:hypothetical protein SERLA73DRAFT_153149 [Serpula lacrymans var. lacrymans S7.3]